MAAKLHEAGVPVTLVEGESLFHVYPVYVSLPESTESRDSIRNFIENP